MLGMTIAVKTIISVIDIVFALFFIIAEKEEEITAVVAYMISSLFLINTFFIWS